MVYSLQTENLSVGYSGRAVVENIDIEINKGEIVTLIGPNGSGKSTVLKSITKQLEIVGGEAKLNDISITKLEYKDLSKMVAVVLTDRINPELMTCREVVASGRYPYTGRFGILSHADEAIVEESMSMVNVSELAGRSFLELSDGQKQRVLLARAICQKPDILVLDEPTSFLDIKYKVELLQILRKLSSESGATIIMSLHEVELAKIISDRVMCIKNNKVCAFGKPEEIFVPDMIKELYDIDDAAYEMLFGRQ